MWLLSVCFGYSGSQTLKALFELVLRVQFSVLVTFCLLMAKFRLGLHGAKFGLLKYSGLLSSLNSGFGGVSGLLSDSISSPRLRVKFG